MSGCKLHGESFTHGCPGCEAYEDMLDAEIVRRFDLWWRRENLCRRYLGHRFSKTLEPGVTLCRVCGSMTFEASADSGAFERWLGR